MLLPGQAPANFARPQPKTGLFGWLGGLFGHKAAAGDQAAAPSGGGGYGGGAGGRGGGGAARMQAMLDQLNLTPDQKAKIAAIQADTTKKVQAAGGDPDAARAARARQLHPDQRRAQRRSKG